MSLVSLVSLTRYQAPLGTSKFEDLSPHCGDKESPSTRRTNLGPLSLRSCLAPLRDLVPDFDLHLIDAGDHGLERVAAVRRFDHDDVAAAAGIAGPPFGADAHAAVIDDDAHALAVADQVGHIDPFT